MSDDQVIEEDFAASVIRRLSWGWHGRRDGSGFLMWYRHPGEWDQMKTGEAEVYLNAIRVPSGVL